MINGQRYKDHSIKNRVLCTNVLWNILNQNW